MDANPAEPKPTRKLKRKRDDKAPEESLPKEDGNMRDLFGDSEDDDDDGSPVVAAPTSASNPSSTGRQRNAQLFGDSDDE